MKYNLLKYSLMSLFMMLCGNVVAQESDFPKTATWDFTNADVVAAAVALSGTTEAGTIAAIHQVGLQCRSLRVGIQGIGSIEIGIDVEGSIGR